MVTWKLAEDGDALERRWAGAVLATFPNYERLWAAHVVPLTWRVADRRDVAVRAGLREELIELASTHYAVFANLAECHEMLQSDGEHFARRRVYEFYSRVFTAREAADRLVGAVHDVLGLYGGRNVPVAKRRLEVYDARRPGLTARYREAKRRDEGYRGEQVHACGFATYGGRIPRRERLKKWTRLDMVDRLRTAPDRERLVADDFVDGLAQGAQDLAFLEGVLDDFWAECLADLAAIPAADRYRADQGSGATRRGDAALTFNLSSSASSGTFVPPAPPSPPRGPYGHL